MSIFRYFRPGYGGHSNTNAYLLSLLSHYIYEKKDVAGKPSIPGRGNHSTKFRKLFQNLSADNPFNVLTRFSGATEWAILSNSNLVIVVFRGTDDDRVPEWKSNFEYQLRTAPKSWGKNVRVHSGFYSTLSGVYQIIRQKVRERNDNGRIPVYLTGHSRGAALATLCAYRFQKVGGVPVAGVYNHSNPDYEPGATIVPTDGDYHDIKQYCIRLFNRLSVRKRRSQNNPGYLTKHDVKAPFPV